MHDGALLVLRKGDCAFFPQQFQFICAVAPHAGKQTGDGATSINFGHRTEQAGNRRAHPIFRLTPNKGDFTAALHFHMKFIGRHVNMGRKNRFTLLGKFGCQDRRFRQPLDESLAETGRYMLDDQHRCRKISGQPGQNGLQYGRAAGRGADGDHTDMRRRMPPVSLRRTGDRSDTPRLRPAPYHFDFRHQFHRLHQFPDRGLMFRMTNTRRQWQKSQRTCLTSLECHFHFTGTDDAAHDDDGRRLRLHDPARGLQSVHLGHVDIHRDDVGLQALHSLDGLFAVARRADNPDAGIRTKNMHEKVTYHG